MNENLNELFNIEEPTPNSVGEILQASKNNLNQSENKISDFDVDYTEVRDNLKNLISKGSAAIDGILHVASEGDSPRAYEVVGQLIKSVADANKDLIELHKKIKEITDTSVTNNNQTQTKIDNAIFLGITADLQKMLRGQLDQIKQLENGT